VGSRLSLSFYKSFQRNKQGRIAVAPDFDGGLEVSEQQRRHFDAADDIRLQDRLAIAPDVFGRFKGVELFAEYVDRSVPLRFALWMLIWPAPSAATARFGC